MSLMNPEQEGPCALSTTYNVSGRGEEVLAELDIRRVDPDGHLYIRRLDGSERTEYVIRCGVLDCVVQQVVCTVPGVVPEGYKSEMLIEDTGSPYIKFGTCRRDFTGDSTTQF